MKTEIVKYTCDLCNCKCKDATPTEHTATIEFNFGYGSKRDGEHIRLDLCAKCAEKSFKNVLLAIKMSGKTQLF